MCWLAGLYLTMYCPGCRGRLKVSLHHFVAAEGTHRCEHCDAELSTDSNQFRLVTSAAQYRTLREWAEAHPDLVTLTDEDTACVPSFGLPQLRCTLST